MSKYFGTRKLIYTAVSMALCVVLPLAFHAIPNGGSLLSPMHLPVLLCGLLCGGISGLLCGSGGVLLSSALTGMPPIAYLPAMLIELSVYGFVSGLMTQFVHTKNRYRDMYVCLITAMLTGRIAAGICRALFFAPEGYSMAMWASSYFITAWPGIVMQLVLLPAIVVRIENAGLAFGGERKLG